jgi:hypothetical protein
MSPCHAFISPSCSLREKSSLPFFCKCGEPWLLVFLYLIAAYPSVRQCVIIICGAHNISLKYLFPEKMFIEVCCQKCQKCNTICVTTFFYWISRVCKRKRFKYIHQNLRYYETIEQIHLMVVIESYVWEKNYNI